MLAALLLLSGLWSIGCDGGGSDAGGASSRGAGGGAAEEPSCEARVATMKQRLASGDTEFAVPESAPAWVSDKAEAIRAAEQPSQRARLVAEGMSRSIRGCAELVGVFKTIAVMPADRKDAAFRREAPKAIAACECEGVDVDAFETMARLSVAMGP